MKYYRIYWIDPVLSIGIAVYLIWASYGLLVKTVKILMQFTPTDIDLKKITEEISSIENVKNIHHVHIWQLDEKQYFLEAHLDMKKDIAVSEFQKIIDKVDIILHEHNISHFNIQPEFNRKDSKKIIAEH